MGQPRMNIAKVCCYAKGKSGLTIYGVPFYCRCTGRG